MLKKDQLELHQQGGEDKANPVPLSGEQSSDPWNIQHVLMSSAEAPTGVRNLTIIVFALSVLVGIPLIQKAGMQVLWLGLIGFLSGLFYTAPPFRFSSRKGLGELLIGINFGPLMVAGSTLIQTGQLLPEAFLAGIPLGFLIAAVVYVNEFPDHDSDKATGKNTLIVVFGPEKARVGYVALVSGAFLSIVLLVLNGTFPSLILITLSLIHI